MRLVKTLFITTTNQHSVRKVEDDRNVADYSGCQMRRMRTAVSKFKSNTKKEEKEKLGVIVKFT